MFGNFNFNDLAEKLPVGIRIMNLSNCNVESLYDVANLFYKCTNLDLSSNLIREIDFDMDFGTVTYLYMAGCPVGDQYFNWDNQYTEEYPGYVISNGVYFSFGYFEDYMWVISD